MVRECIRSRVLCPIQSVPVRVPCRGSSVSALQLQDRLFGIGIGIGIGIGRFDNLTKTNHLIQKKGTKSNHVRLVAVGRVSAVVCAADRNSRVFLECAHKATLGRARRTRAHWDRDVSVVIARFQQNVLDKNK